MLRVLFHFAVQLPNRRIVEESIVARLENSTNDQKFEENFKNCRVAAAVIALNRVVPMSDKKRPDAQAVLTCFHIQHS